ncbi:MAG: hypothetical protein ABSH50_31345 [Bryobacteraceae bacterium]|jgi:hypothetical protein
MSVDQVKQQRKQKQLEADAAVDDWEQADKNLLHEVLGNPSPDTLKKIEKARSLSHEMAQKRMELFDANTAVYQNLLNHSWAGGAQTSGAALVQQLKDYAREGIATVDEQMADLRKELAQIANDPKEQIRRAIINKQLADLDREQGLLLKEQHDDDSISAADVEFDQKRRDLQNIYRGLIADYDAWKASTKEEEQESDSYYKQLAGMVEKASQAQPPPQSKPAPDDKPGGDKSGTVVVVRNNPPLGNGGVGTKTTDPPPPAPHPPTSSFGGKWAWRQGMVAVSPPGYVPKQVVIEISDVEGEIRGKFFGLFNAPKHAFIKQPVAFEFHGTRSESQIAGGTRMTFPFRSSDGWTGSVTLNKFNEILEVDWSAVIDPANTFSFEYSMERADTPK